MSTPATHTHSVFSPRDLTRWVIGLARSTASSADLCSFAIQLHSGVASPHAQCQAGPPHADTLALGRADEALRVHRERLDTQRSVVHPQPGERALAAAGSNARLPELPPAPVSSADGPARMSLPYSQQLHCQPQMPYPMQPYTPQRCSKHPRSTSLRPLSPHRSSSSPHRSFLLPLYLRHLHPHPWTPQMLLTVCASPLSTLVHPSLLCTRD